MHRNTSEVVPTSGYRYFFQKPSSRQEGPGCTPVLRRARVERHLGGVLQEVDGPKVEGVPVDSLGACNSVPALMSWFQASEWLLWLGMCHSKQAKWRCPERRTHETLEGSRRSKELVIEKQESTRTVTQTI